MTALECRARHANPAAARTPSARTVFRVTLTTILAVAAFWDQIQLLLTLAFVAVLVCGLYAAGVLGVIR